jgi:hypothetical protein
MDVESESPSTTPDDTVPTDEGPFYLNLRTTANNKGHICAVTTAHPLITQETIRGRC